MKKISDKLAFGILMGMLIMQLLNIVIALFYYSLKS